MPVTLTTGQLAVEMRLSTDPATVPTEYAEILTRALDTAKEHVEAYVAETAPQSVVDLAAAKMAGYLVDSPSVMGMPAIAFRNSGCASILAPWHIPIGIRV